MIWTILFCIYLGSIIAHYALNEFAFKKLLDDKGQQELRGVVLKKSFGMVKLEASLFASSLIPIVNTVSTVMLLIEIGRYFYAERHLRKYKRMFNRYKKMAEKYERKMKEIEKLSIEMAQLGAKIKDGMQTLNKDDKNE